MLKISDIDLSIKDIGMINNQQQSALFFLLILLVLFLIFYPLDYNYILFSLTSILSLIFLAIVENTYWILISSYALVS